jgi:hypothetical protein
MSHGAKGRRKASTLTTIDERYTTDHQGPSIEEDESLYHKRIREGRAIILEYGITMQRHNVLCVIFV